jgi:hypothetical protein
MAKLIFTNKRSIPTRLTIEPWAQYDEIPANGVVEIEFSDAPPPELQFSIENLGDALIYINTEHVKIRVNGQDRDFGFGERAPSLPPGMQW